MGGEPVPVEPGACRVEVLTDPAVEFKLVELGGGEKATLQLLGDAETPPGS